MNFYLFSVLSFVLGLVLGYLLRKMSSKNETALTKTLKETQAQLNEQNARVQAHYEASAELLAKLDVNYRALVSHFASQPEAKNIALFQEFTPTAAVEHLADPDHAPRDYSEGSSGLLKNAS